MFGWITGGRIRELEGKLEDKIYDYARLMRNCDEHIHEINFKDHEINALYEKLATNHKRLMEQDEVIASLDAICREQDAKIQRLYANRSRPSRDPVTGRFMKRTDTRPFPNNRLSGDGLRASLRYDPPITNADADNAAS